VSESFFYEAMFRIATSILFSTISTVLIPFFITLAKMGIFMSKKNIIFLKVFFQYAIVIFISSFLTQYESI